MGERVKRRNVITAAAVVVAASVGVGLVVQGSGDLNRIRQGDAFGAEDGSYEIGMPTVLVNEEVWYMTPSMTNRSSETLTLEDLQPGTTPEGITFIGARLFEKEVFIAGAPLSWDTGGGSAYDPSTRVSSGVQGLTLLPGQRFPDDKIIYLHIRVTTSKRPLKVDGVKFIYEQNGRRYSQTLSASLAIVSQSQRR
ncbi:hypothetical protein ACQPYH_38495 [Kribbella sp. CA-245084]|uniref:hypothetical protein n=1 Tax=Kribbella sp. CA-245084 TaxID=3239940 RepID=UPI003D89EF82